MEEVEVQQSLKCLQTHFESLDQALNEIESKFSETPNGQRILSLLERIEKLKRDYSVSVELNEHVLERKTEIASVLHQQIIQLMSSVQKGKQTVRIPADMYRDNAANSALSAVTDWKLDLEGGNRNSSVKSTN